MKESSQNHTWRAFLGVVGGVIAAFIAGFILWPLIKLFVDRYFNVYLFVRSPPGAWKRDLIAGATIGMWFFISSLVGGFICAFIATRREFNQVFTCFIVALTLLFLVYGEELLREKSFVSWLILVAVPLGYFSGCFAATYVKQKRKSRSSLDVIN